MHRCYKRPYMDLIGLRFRNSLLVEGTLTLVVKDRWESSP